MRNKVLQLYLPPAENLWGRGKEDRQGARTMSRFRC
jgi:hypothetical protein